MMAPPLCCVLVGSGSKTCIVQLSSLLVVVVLCRVVFELISVVLMGARTKVDQLGLAVAQHQNFVLLGLQVTRDGRMANLPSKGESRCDLKPITDPLDPVIHPP